MFFSGLILAASLLLHHHHVAKGHLRSRHAECPPFDKGTILIDSYQLYPENADFDLSRCLVYLGALYNASVVVYDPYRAETVATLEFPNITRTPPFHIGAVAWDPYTDLVTILVDAAAAHETGGRDISGDNYVMRYDPAAAADGVVLWSLNISEVARGRYGGPQDVEHDARGHVYVLGTYPGTILRVEPDGSAIREWYLPEVLDHTVSGFSGFAALGDILLVSDTRNNSVEDGGSAIYRFDMTAETGTPVLVPLTMPPSNNNNSSSSSNTTTPRPPPLLLGHDAIYLPPKYNGTVLLLAEHDRGVSVLRSRDAKWETAEYVGLVPNNNDDDEDDPALDAGALVTAPLEIAGSLYMVEDWFTDALVPGTSAGNRSVFPLVDITGRVEELLLGARCDVMWDGRLCLHYR
ncbi:hypothetical protein F4778DRAFT_783124 [Xylariomycetidae sp. FL2044]|nr:hypothetical protein F4778DRAFT_783124 [Xylariomycetidae sp. FL2044]